MLAHSLRESGCQQHGIAMVRKCRKTYRATEHAVPLVTTLLDVILQSSGIQRFQELEATEQLP